MTSDPHGVSVIPDPAAAGCCAVAGVFYRAVDQRHRAAAINGSRAAGRYSRADQPTLYLSASRAGVAAALRAHGGLDPAVHRVLSLAVTARSVVNLRDPAVLAHARAVAGDPLAPWQACVAAGGQPPSWRVRDWLEQRGADGLIDPSRTAPGLWHLVLFRWNTPGAPQVTLLPEADPSG